MAYNDNKMDKAKLLKVGTEAFKILEEYGKRPPKKAPANARPSVPKAAACVYHYQPQQTLVCKVMDPVSSTEEIISSYEAMKLNDERLLMDYSKRKSATMAY